MAIRGEGVAMRPYVDKTTGKFHGYYSDGNPSIPSNAVAIETSRPEGAADYDLQNQRWNIYDPPVEEKRLKEYLTKLGTQGDQNDAIYKGIRAMTNLLIDKGLLTQQDLQDAGLIPDKTEPADTPAGWLGKVEDIKKRYPKED